MSRIKYVTFEILTLYSSQMNWMYWIDPKKITVPVYISTKSDNETVGFYACD